jgi:hypothetical protein
MVRRASEKETFFGFFPRLIFFRLALSLSSPGGVFFFYFCIAKLELGYCCYFF